MSKVKQVHFISPVQFGNETLPYLQHNVHTNYHIELIEAGIRVLKKYKDEAHLYIIPFANIRVLQIENIAVEEIIETTKKRK